MLFMYTSFRTYQPIDWNQKRNPGYEDREIFFGSHVQINLNVFLSDIFEIFKILDYGLPIYIYIYIRFIRVTPLMCRK